MVSTGAAEKSCLSGPLSGVDRPHAPDLFLQGVWGLKTLSVKSVDLAASDSTR